MNFIKIFILSLILLLPVIVSNTIAFSDDENRFELLQNCDNEEEDERGNDEILEEGDYILFRFAEVISYSVEELVTQSQINYRNGFFNSFKPEVLTPPPKRV